MKTPQEFQAYYEASLRPVLEELEARRKRICTTFLGTLAGVLTLGLALGLPLLRPGQNPQFLIVIAVIGGGILLLTWHLLTRGFILDFKQRVIAAIVGFVDPSLRYSPERCVAQSRFVESSIFLQRIDRFNGEDYIAGTVGKTALEFSELHAQYKTESRDSKGHRRTQWHTIFKGTFFVADFNKAFHGVTVVLPDVAQRFLGFVGQKLQEMNRQRGQLIKLEDPEFEKLFVVYGSDQVEARYLLSTSLISRIVAYRQKTGNQLHLAFVNSHVFVAITTGTDMFEPPIFSSLMDIEVCRRYLDDLQLVLAIVDDLNLNTRIWTKE